MSVLDALYDTPGRDAPPEAWRRYALVVAGSTSRADASLRRSMLLVARGAQLTALDREHLRGAVEALASGYAMAALHWLRWALAGALVVAALSGCSSSRIVDDAGATSDASSSSGDVVDGCIPAANAANAANVRLRCHVVASCWCWLDAGVSCLQPRADVVACVDARAASTTCADLAPPACSFSPLFPTGGL